VFAVSSVTGTPSTVVVVTSLKMPTLSARPLMYAGKSPGGGIGRVASGGYTSAGLRKRTRLLSTTVAVQLRSPGESSVGADPRAGATTTLSGMPNFTDV